MRRILLTLITLAGCAAQPLPAPTCPSPGDCEVRSANGLTCHFLGDVDGRGVCVCARPGAVWAP